MASGPPLCERSPPATPPSYNISRRPGLDIDDRCPIEGVSPNHVPPGPSAPCRCRPCACPRISPTEGPYPTPSSGASPSTLPKPSDIFSHCWNQCSARLIPLQDWDAPLVAGVHPERSERTSKAGRQSCQFCLLWEVSVTLLRTRERLTFPPGQRRFISR